MEKEKLAQEYYDRFVQYERNPISNSMKQSIIDAITEAYIDGSKRNEAITSELMEALKEVLPAAKLWATRNDHRDYDETVERVGNVKELDGRIKAIIAKVKSLITKAEQLKPE